MKILITVQTYYPQKDGVQTVTQYLAEGLAQKGNDVTVITGIFDNTIEEENVNNVLVKRVKLWTKYGLYFGEKKKYKELIRKECEKNDVMINVCTQNAFTDVILSSIKDLKIKKILYLHGIFDFKFHLIDFSSLASTANKLWKEIRWFFYYAINKKNLKKYDKVINLHEKDYTNNFFKRKYGINTFIIENAASEDFFEKKVLPEFKKPFEKYFILVANYDDRKNQKLAIEEFLKSNIDKNIGLVLIGSKKNKYYDKLEKLIVNLRKKYNLKNEEKPILMLHDIEKSLVSSYVSNAYLYLMTSKWEAYPISLVESMASGVPFISTNVGIIKYFVGGIVSNKKDISYWLEKLSYDEKLRNELSSVCSIFADVNFKIDDKVNKLEKLLK